MSANRTGVYPGTFDPTTNGHVDIIGRAIKIVDKLVIAVAVNAGKDPLFTLDERVTMVRDELEAMDGDVAKRSQVVPFDSLLVDFVGEVDASMIVRGLRAVSDFEYEFQMAGMNSRLNPYVETVFLMASDRHQFIASRFVKEIGRLGGDIGHFVSPRIKEQLFKRIAETNGSG